MIACVYLYLKGSHVEEYRPVYRGDRQRERDTFADCAAAFIPAENVIIRVFWFTDIHSQTALWISLQETELHTHGCCCCCCYVLWGTQSQSSASATVWWNRAACAFKFHDPLFTAGPGWQGALVHAALNNWDCKVNVRRMAKDGSFPPPASTPASVSWIHTSKCHTRPQVAVGHVVSDHKTDVKRWLLSDRRRERIESI